MGDCQLPLKQNLTVLPRHVICNLGSDAYTQCKY